MPIVYDPMYGQMLLHNFVKVALASFSDSKEKSSMLFQALQRIIDEITDASGLTFFTPFTRIAYMGSALRLPNRQLFTLHFLRKHRDDGSISEEEKISLLIWAGVDLLKHVYKISLPLDIEEHLPPYKIFSPSDKSQFIKKGMVKGAVTKVDKANFYLDFLPEGGEEEIRVLFNVTGKNDLFNESIALLEDVITLPAGISLLDVEEDEQGQWIPAGFVLVPDYLIDVSSLAEAAAHPHLASLQFLLRKYMPAAQSEAILIGNVANYFLDELIQRPDLSFKEACSRLFKEFPLAFVSMSDAELKRFLEKLKPHFATLYRQINEEFPRLKIERNKALVEPSFYAVELGLQGRLDLFYKSKEQTVIVELKSGKPFRPNKYGLSDAHYFQTLLYDLLIHAVYPEAFRSIAYILYSVDYEHPLRYAPVIRAQQMEALQVRNQLIGIEFQLCALSDITPIDLSIFARIRVQDYPGIYGFALEDLMRFERVFGGLGDLEKKYFQGLAGMIAREQRLAKIGRSGREGQEGQAALWQKGLTEKEEAFEIMQQLRIMVNVSMQEDPMLRMVRTENTNDLANFRTGDIVVLYPHVDGKAPERDQLVKCSIASMDEDGLWLRLRARQSNDQFFDHYPLWNLEPDWLDSSFIGSSRGLYEWASASPEKRQRILGLIPPRELLDVEVLVNADDLTAEQRNVCANIIRSQDIALLWGPPGTGKTSKVLHHVIRYLLEKTAENVLVVAYTNRAVDEICETLTFINHPGAAEYIRIGSRFGTAPEHQHRLLDVLAKESQGRSGLLEIFQKTRLVVGTVASVQGKSELLSLMSFDRLIVDEASQILEPAMAGLLARFEKSLLIGDHLQLPAVMVQPARETMWRDEGVRSIGFENMRDSLFERLLRQYRLNGWDWACLQLSYQGRMHQDIMEFPNHLFYKSALQILPDADFDHFQKAPLPESLVLPQSYGLPQALSLKRVVFIPVSADPDPLSPRTNLGEADLMVDMLRFFRESYGAHRMSFGIITPFRAQIAAIRQAILKANIPLAGIQIDTVERFQGGARDIILVSLCVNNTRQLAQLVSKSTDGVDRKLNVALTRARQHLVLVGNPQVLQNDEVYAAFMEKYSPAID
jgi:DNA replication ATP-dependent helicase Dna2